MRILLLSGRAPATLELARGFGLCGWEVYVADSIEATVSRYSKHVTSFLKINSPRFCQHAFIDDLVQIINDNCIDVLFPTCEEIFWVAKNKRRLQENCNAQILCDGIETLTLLHNKYRLIEFAKSLGLCVPQTQLLQECQKIEKKSVIKPLFSRFGEDIIIAQPNSEIRQYATLHKPCIVQEFVQGENICSYGFAKEGMLQFNVCYKSPFPAKTCTAFEPFLSADVTKIVQTVISKLNFTGNISFDFIRQGEEYFVIECNPRITSGIHTLSNNPFDQLFFGEVGHLKLDCAQLRLPTIASSFQFLSCRDVIWDWADKAPFWKQIQCLLLFHAIAKENKISLVKAMTFDIEWNGE